MTTRTGARIYRHEPRPLAPGACPQCGRVVPINTTGHRRRHLDKPRGGRPCTGGGVFVGERVVLLDDLPPVVVPPGRSGRLRTGCKQAAPSDPRRCPYCDQRPRIKADGAMAAHRVAVDDPSSPYCPGGAPKSRV